MLLEFLLFSNSTLFPKYSQPTHSIKYYTKAKKSPKCLVLSSCIQLSTWHLHLEFNRQLKFNLPKSRLWTLLTLNPLLPNLLHFCKWYHHPIKPKTGDILDSKTSLIPLIPSHLPSNPLVSPTDSITVTSPNPITSLHSNHHYPHINHYHVLLRLQNFALSCYSGDILNITSLEKPSLNTWSKIAPRLKHITLFYFFS